MNLQKLHKQMLASDEFAQYSLRATFFVRSLRSMKLFETIQEVQGIANLKADYDWDDAKSYGIETDVFKRVQKAKINPILIFCHPKLLTEQPRLLLYYRTLALISQKGLGSLIGGNLAAIEAGKIERLDEDWLERAVVALNSILSAIIRTAAEIDARHFPGYQFASAGSTIQGSWNNAIGSEGERAVKTIVVNNIKDEIVQIGWRAGPPMDYTPAKHVELIDRLGDVRVIRLKEAFSLLFASEPDVSLRDSKGVPQIAIEVKAGADPAGALERLGAAMKSFDNDRAINPRVKTVYVVRCMTPELKTRIDQMNPFDYTFGLAELLADERSQKRFVSIIVKHLLKR